MIDEAKLEPPSDREPLQEQAAGWAAYLNCGEATDEDRQRFSRWLDRSPAHVRAYQRAEQTWRDLGFAAETFVQPVRSTDAARDAGGDAVVRPLDAARRRHRPPPAPLVGRRRVLAGAGALAASLLVAVGVWRVGVYDPVTTAQYETRIGEVRMIALGDGSRITLRPASALVTRLSKKERRVELARGGAYFDVASNQDRPFTVTSAAISVRVVGTGFEVLRRERGVNVAVAEGIVDVAQVLARSGEDGGPAPPSRARLGAGQQVFAAPDGALDLVRPFAAETGLAWRSGRLVFRDARLADVLAEINGYRDVKVSLADPALGEMRVTTGLRVDETDKLLRALEATRPVTVARSTEGVVIHAKR